MHFKVIIIVISVDYLRYTKLIYDNWVIFKIIKKLR